MLVDRGTLAVISIGRHISPARFALCNRRGGHKSKGRIGVAYGEFGSLAFQAQAEIADVVSVQRRGLHPHAYLALEHKLHRDFSKG